MDPSQIKSIITALKAEMLSCRQKKGRGRGNRASTYITIIIPSVTTASVGGICLTFPLTIMLRATNYDVPLVTDTPVSKGVPSTSNSGEAGASRGGGGR